jgi:hypothetical protein
MIQRSGDLGPSLTAGQADWNGASQMAIAIPVPLANKPGVSLVDTQHNL